MTKDNEDTTFIDNYLINKDRKLDLWILGMQPYNPIIIMTRITEMQTGTPPPFGAPAKTFGVLAKFYLWFSSSYGFSNFLRIWRCGRNTE